MATTNVFNKKYLTSIEIMFIINEMNKHEDSVTREVVKIALVAQYTLKDLDKENFEDCNEIYDYVVKNGIDLKKNIFNYQDLENIAKTEFGLDTFIKNFIISSSEEIKKSIENVDVNEVINKINEYSESKEALETKFTEV